MSRLIAIVEKYQCVGAVYAVERNGGIWPVSVNDCTDVELITLSSAARQRFESEAGGPGDAVEASQLHFIVAARKKAREKGVDFKLTTKFVEAADQLRPQTRATRSRRSSI